MKNHGIQVAPPSPTDFRAGRIPFKERNRKANWKAYIPSGERQRFRYFDSSACVSFSALNIIETQLHFMRDKGLLPEEHLDFLDDYEKDGEYNLSDRFTAKMSGTTRSGNYLFSVADSLRNHGAVPEEYWPASENFDWDDYYQNIPPYLVNKGKEFVRYFDISYEWVLLGHTDPNVDNRYEFIKEQLQHAPIQVATHLTDSWKSGEVAAGACEPVQHAYMVFNTEDERYHILDHYTPYMKQLDADYCLLWGMKIVIEPKEVKEPEYYVAIGEQWYLKPDEISGFATTTTRLNYRRQPYVSDDTFVKTLPTGTKLEILGYAGNAGGYHWLKVKIV